MSQAAVSLEPVSGGASRRGPAGRRVFSWRPSFAQVVLGVPVIYMLIMYAYPIGDVLARSVTDPHPGFGNFHDALTDRVVLKVLWITVRIALEVAVASTLLGFPVAYLMATRGGRTARVVGLLVIIPFWTSVLVRSFAWIVLLGDGGLVAKILEPIRGNTHGLLYSEPAVVIAMVHVLLPYTVLITKSALDHVDMSLLSAARTLGASPLRAYLRIFAPLAAPALISSGLLVFVLSLGYYITPALVGGAKQTTIAMLIQQQVSVTFQWGAAATLSTILLVLSLVLVLVIRRFTRVGGTVSL